LIILEENFKWHLEAFASELFICSFQEQNSLWALNRTELHHG